ncbi:Detected protein of confused Function [Hibiscus syriacus]|uniref:Detected protein of confused Function n=1 Tax=Hibiscus syriacus TaxID=106335 RepID=A0A6A3B9R6_HIBSY|nr:Detected protein of confused Function [Hibiscus syriacus]
MCFMSGSIEMENTFVPENEVGMWHNVRWRAFMSDAFLCSINDVKVNNIVDQRPRNVVTGVEGFLRQKLSGQGLAFILAGGSVVQKNLEVGEVLAVDMSRIAALTTSIVVQIKYNGPIRRAVFGNIWKASHAHWCYTRVGSDLWWLLA